VTLASSLSAFALFLLIFQDNLSLFLDQNLRDTGVSFSCWHMERPLANFIPYIDISSTATQQPSYNLNFLALRSFYTRSGIRKSLISHTTVPCRLSVISTSHSSNYARHSCHDILYQETSLAQSCSRVYRNSNGEAWDMYNL
jgi:hypothetical protein